MKLFKEFSAFGLFAIPAHFTFGWANFGIVAAGLVFWQPLVFGIGILGVILHVWISTSCGRTPFLPERGE